MFLDFLGLGGSLKEQAEEFLKNAKRDSEWIQENLIQFVSHQNDRAKLQLQQEGTLSKTM
jgi:hypothetical protein